MGYAVVIEKADGNYSAYGCVATGDTVETVEAEIRDAIRFHINGLKADGLQVPQNQPASSITLRLRVARRSIASPPSQNWSATSWPTPKI